jgi:hypothetical protein
VWISLLGVHEARFFFDNGGVLWMQSLEGQERWNNPADLDLLPISQPLRDELERLIDWYDTSMNWDYPPDPGPWREPECERFNRAVHMALSRLREELGAGWNIVNGFHDMHEDPDLERYLANPRAFWR